STASATCSAPQDMTLVMATSHMHARGVSFEAYAGDDRFFVTDSWTDPSVTMYDPGVAIHKGEPITYACDYVNTTGRTIEFGRDADQEMCVLAGVFYPSPGSASATRCIAP